MEELAVFGFVCSLFGIELLEPAAEIAHDVLRCDRRGGLKLPIDSVLINFLHGINALGFLNIESYHLDGILLLVDVIGGFVDFSEAALSNKIDIFELFLESSGIEDVM